MSVDKRGSNGRLANGQFATGNKLGSGNPNARRMYEYRRRLICDAPYPNALPRETQGRGGRCCERATALGKARERSDVS